MSYQIAKGHYLNQVVALQQLIALKNANISSELWENLTDYFNRQETPKASPPYVNWETVLYLDDFPAIKVFFYCLYILICSVGIFGNALVCYVVFRNKGMQTVTNLFITNLAVSDILLCVFSVPFTPLYLLVYHSWEFGNWFCHLVPYAQGVSVYISAFTLMSIAIDRFFVIIYPFKPRMEIRVCMIIVACIWVSAALLTLPYGLYMERSYVENTWWCEEAWPQDESRKAFGFSTSTLQFVIPFIIISFCYLMVCSKLHDRARFKPGAKSLRKEEIERERTRRTNRMLISMVVIFGVSWLPLNINNLVQDFYPAMAKWKFTIPFFLLAHAAAMSSTCYNPFLYAWLNENFRKEFKQVLPCFRVNSGTTSSTRRVNMKQERTCNGHDTINESLLPNRNNSVKEIIPMNDGGQTASAPQTSRETRFTEDQTITAAADSSPGAEPASASTSAATSLAYTVYHSHQETKTPTVKYMASTDSVKLQMDTSIDAESV